MHAAKREIGINRHPQVCKHLYVLLLQKKQNID